MHHFYFELNRNFLRDDYKHAGILEGRDSNFKVNIFQILKVATNETSTLY